MMSLTPTLRNHLHMMSLVSLWILNTRRGGWKSKRENNKDSLNLTQWLTLQNSFHQDKAELTMSHFTNVSQILPPYFYNTSSLEETKLNCNTERK